MLQSSMYRMLFVVILLLSCEKTDDTTQEYSDTNHQETNNTMAKITLSNGNTVFFHQINEGQLQGTFLLEESECASTSVLNNMTKLAKKELSDSEIFWALSEPGADIPNFLNVQNIQEKSSDLLSSDEKEQGWAREVAVTFPLGNEGTPSRVIACTNSNFSGSIAGGFLGNPEFVALDKTPNTYNGFVDDCANLSPSACNKGTRYRLHAEMRGIKKWKGKICSKAVQSSTNDHYISNSISGSYCQSPPCSAYVGPQLYFEYYSNGQWKSMKNPSGKVPEGFEVPANTTKVYTYSWNTSVETSFRLRVKNAMGYDQFDLMMDREDIIIEDDDDDDGGNNGGNEVPNPKNFPRVPQYINLSGGDDIIIDFNTTIEGQPSITLPVDFLPVLPYYEGEIIFPNNFCGLRVVEASQFVWFDIANEEVTTGPFNYVDEDSSVLELFGNEYYLQDGIGIRLTGAMGPCEEGNQNWMFPYPLTTTETVDYGDKKLVIDLESGSKIEFLNYAIHPAEPLDYHEIFEEHDFDELIEFFNETFYEGFEPWIDAMCEQNPSDCPLND